MIKNLLLFGVFILSTLTGLAQAPTVTLSVEDGTQPDVCRGSQIQIFIDITPPDTDPTQTYNFNVTQNPPVQGEGNFVFGGSSDEPTDSFFFRSPEVNTTYTIEVFGQFAVTETIDITVDQLPNAGFDTDIFLCNRDTNFNLIDELDGFPDTGGVWSNGTGIYDVSDQGGGVFTYTITTPGACPDQVATITVNPCGNNDVDGDGIPNATDLDADNDGISDIIEDGFCGTGGAGQTPVFVLEEDFGFGNLPVRSRFVEGSGLNFEPGQPQDNQGGFGEYAVANSLHFRSTNSGFLSTTGDIDANGDTEGRYLVINMVTDLFDADRPVFSVQSLPVSETIEYTLGMNLVNTGGGQSPNLEINVVDADNPANAPLLSIASGPIGNVGVWQEFNDTFTVPVGVESVNIEIINLLTDNLQGNDLGIDNIFLSRLQCDFDRDGIPNSQDLDSDNDGILDYIENGVTTAINDADGNGYPDTALTGVTVINSNDGDVQPDFLDIDSDNDGILDNFEFQATANYIAPTGIDGNFNGADDAYDDLTNPIIPVTTDGGAEPDYLNTNVDNDCLGDTIEAFDTNRDGALNNGERSNTGNADVDGDGLLDGFDNVVLDRVTGGNTNALNGDAFGDLLNQHNPETPELDWREDFSNIGPIAVSVGDPTNNCDPEDLYEDVNALFTPEGIVAPITGNWATPAPLALTGGFLGTLDPEDLGYVNGNYTYTIPAFGGTSCPAQIITLAVTINDECRCPTIAAPTRVSTNPVTICIDAPTLPTLEASAPPATPADFQVRWLDGDDATTATVLQNNSATYQVVQANLTVGNTTSFFAQYYNPTTMCFSDFVEFEVTATAAPTAGTGPANPVQFCSADNETVNAAELFARLTGNPTAGGTWEGPGNTTIGTADVAAATGDYVYTVQSDGCTDTATVEVVVTTSPTLAENTVTCNNPLETTYEVSYFNCF